MHDVNLMATYCIVEKIWCFTVNQENFKLKNKLLECLLGYALLQCGRYKTIIQTNLTMTREGCLRANMIPYTQSRDKSYQSQEDFPRNSQLKKLFDNDLICLNNETIYYPTNLRDALSHVISWNQSKHHISWAKLSLSR